MLDLIIRGGKVVTPNGAGLWDVGIADGKIAVVAAPEVLQNMQAARTLDASGKIVIPGGIDPHIHCSWPVNPGLDGTEPVFSAGPEQVSRAAFARRHHDVIDFAVCDPGDRWEAALRRRDADWKGHLPFSISPTTSCLPARYRRSSSRSWPEAIQAGYPTIKIFTTNIPRRCKGRKIGFGDIWEIFKVLPSMAASAAIHAEENDIVMHMYEKLIREDRVGFENMAEVHNTCRRTCRSAGSSGWPRISRARRST